MANEIMCKVCTDMGFNSTGDLCYSRKANGWQPLKDAVLGAITEVFAKHYDRDEIPSEDDVAKAVHGVWACEPSVYYAARYQDADGVEVNCFAGTTPNINEMLAVAPKDNVCTAVILKLTKTTLYGERACEPIARWKNGRWQMKRHQSIIKDSIGVHRYEGDPVCIDRNGFYYFWDETWVELSGPFDNLEDCDKAVSLSCKQ